MAKEKVKDPAELSVEEKLSNLYSLQTVLSKIDEIKTQRGELPLEVQDLEDEIEGLTTRIKKITNEIAEQRAKQSRVRQPDEANRICRPGQSAQREAHRGSKGRYGAEDSRSDELQRAGKRAPH